MSSYSPNSLKKRVERTQQNNNLIKQQFAGKTSDESKEILRKLGLSHVINENNQDKQNKKLKDYNPSVKKKASDKEYSHKVEKVKKATEEESSEQKIQYVRNNDYSVDNSEILVQNIQNAKLSLMRELIEIVGEEFGDDEANVEYRNYMSDKIIASTPNGIQMVGFGEFTSGVMIDPGSVGDTGLSDGMLDMICRYETGKPFGYTMGQKDLVGYDLGDAKGHKTFGYGLLYHPTTKQFMDSMKAVWTQQELETLFKVYAKNTVNRINSWASSHNIQLNQRQIDAIACACYNFGSGFLNKNICKMIATNPEDPNIFNTWCHLSDVQGQKYPGLIKRRQAEANWYFGK